MIPKYCECCKTNIIFHIIKRSKPNKNLRYCNNCSHYLKLYGSNVHSQYYRKIHRLLKFISNQKKMGASSKLILKNLKKEITREVASSARSPPK